MGDPSRTSHEPSGTNEQKLQPGSRKRFTPAAERTRRYSQGLAASSKLTFPSIFSEMDEEVAVGDGARGGRIAHHEVHPARHPGGVDDHPKLAHVGVHFPPIPCNRAKGVRASPTARSSPRKGRGCRGRKGKDPNELAPIRPQSKKNKRENCTPARPGLPGLFPCAAKWARASGRKAAKNSEYNGCTAYPSMPITKRLRPPLAS